MGSCYHQEFNVGVLKEQAQSVKDLMVRPYLPRFLREGDTAELKVVVNNTSDHDLKGEVSLDLLDPETEASLASEFGLTKKVSVRSQGPRFCHADVPNCCPRQGWNGGV